MSLRHWPPVALALAGIVALASTGWLAGHGDNAAPTDVVAGPPALRPVAAPAVDPGTTGGARTRSGESVDPAWLRRTVTRTGIPRRALLAYADATITVDRRDPGCHLGWTTLAGIGSVESQHGTIDGRTLGPDGRPNAPIAGPVLDGQGSVAAIRTGGRWARARGPMQFLGATWVRWRADGDGDGVTDVDDLDDAALAAARYLCAAGGDLSTAESWNRAVMAYNHSTAYAWAVYRAATQASS